MPHNYTVDTTISSLYAQNNEEKNSEETNVNVSSTQTITKYEAEGYYWYDDVNIANKSDATDDNASCENSEKIRAEGDSSTYPAVWAAYNYTTEGTEAGDWCLPAAGVFFSYDHGTYDMYKNFEKIGGEKIPMLSIVFSSTEFDYRYVWVFTNDGPNRFSTSNKPSSNEVRPVIEF